MSHENDFGAEVVRLKLPLTVKTVEACKLMSIGATKLRELIAEGRIDARKRDKDLIIITASILEYQATLPRAKFKAKSIVAA